MQRQVYLRIPSRLILRIEGRTPGDDPASYTIKFGGVFKSIAASAVKRNPGDPKVSGNEASEGAVARVNSAGTIIEEIRQPPTPEPPKETGKNTAKEKAKPATTVDTRSKSVSKPAVAANTGKPKTTAQEKPKTDLSVKKIESEKTAAKTKTPVEKPKTGAETAKSSSSAKKLPENKTDESKPKPTSAVTKPPKNVSDPLAKLELVVDMKDGRKLKYAMNDVLRVNVDRSVVTIILKNGDIERLSLLEIEEMKIGQ
jgi:DNA polymerase III gamma/tau subunit